MAKVRKPQVFINDTWTEEPRAKRLLKLYLREIVGLWGNDYEANFDTIFEAIKGAFGVMGYNVICVSTVIQVLDNDSGRIFAEIRQVEYYTND